jgi:hypothetical protein
VEETWRRDDAQLAAEALLPASLKIQDPPSRFCCYEFEAKWWRQHRSLNIVLSLGAVQERHIHLLLPKTFSVAFLYAPDESIFALVSPGCDEEQLARLWEKVIKPLQELDIKQVKTILQQMEGWRPVTLTDLSFESRESLGSNLLHNIIDQYRQSLAEIYGESQDTMRMFREINLPIPKIFSTLAKAVITDQAIEIIQNINASTPIPASLSRLAMQARALGIKINDPYLERMVESLLEKESRYLHIRSKDYQRHLERLDNLLSFVGAFSMQANLWRVQNNFYLLTRMLGGACTQDVIDMSKRLGFSAEIFH